MFKETLYANILIERENAFKLFQFSIKENDIIIYRKASENNKYFLEVLKLSFKFIEFI